MPRRPHLPRQPCGRPEPAGSTLRAAPAPLEAELRHAGVDGFVHVGSDVPAVLDEVLDGS